MDINNCDKCKQTEHTQDLVWITAEDFEPRKGEVVPKELYKKFDALCEPCYFSEITLKD